MPRTPIDSAERALLGSASLAHHIKVEIANADGTLIDLTTAGGVDWLNGVTVEESPDAPVMSAVVTLQAEHGALSLNALRSDSTLNRDNSNAYAPLVYGGRRVIISEGVSAPDAATPAYGWHAVFDGVTDDPASVDNGATLRVNARDKFARLLDHIIEVEDREYSTSAGVDVETIMQQLIDDNMTGPGEAVTLVLPGGSPDWKIRKFKQARVSVLEALRTLAAQIAWVVRGVWINDVFVLAFFDPDRTKTVPDFTLPPDEYLRVDELRFDDRNVRNVIGIWYFDRTSGGQRRYLSTQDDTSIDDFGRRYLEFGEADTSNVDTPVEAAAMIGGALSDLAQPMVDHTISSYALYFAQLGDLVAFPANSVHYDDAQQFAIAQITRSWLLGVGKITLLTRGKPIGAYAEWIRRHGAGPRTRGVPSPSIGQLIGEDSEGGGISGDGKLWLDVAFEPFTEAIDVFAEQADTDDVQVPDLTDITKVTRLTRQEGVVGQDRYWRTLIPMATRPLWYKRVRAFGLSKEGLPGPEYLSDAIQAKDTVSVIDGVVTSIAVNYASLDNGVAIDVGAIDPVVPSFLVIMRNGIVITTIYLDTSGNRTLNYSDAGVYGARYTYAAFIWTSGVSGARVKTTAPAPSDPLPTFAQGTPDVQLSGGVPALRVLYAHALSWFDHMVLEMSLVVGPVFAWSDVGTSNTGGFFLSYTGAAWFRLRAESAGATQVLRSLPKYWNGIPPVPGNDITNYPIFSVGVGIVRGAPTLGISWTCANLSAGLVRIQSSINDGVTPWADVYTSAAVASGSWDQGNFAAPTYYRMQALTAAGALLVTSPSQQYTPGFGP